MERKRLSGIDQINLQFAAALDNWQKTPDDRAATEMISSLIDEGYEMGVLQIGIKTEALEKEEGSRAILPSDLTRLARRIGNVWIFNFRPNPSGGKYKVDVITDYLRIKDASYGALVPAAYFEPSEISIVAVV